MGDIKTVTVIGLGYVGLPLACLLAEKGNKVYGLDIDKGRIDLINKGISPINDESLKKKLEKVKITATADGGVIAESEVIVICVPTPVDINNHPDLAPLTSAAKTISKNLKKWQLVIIESTIFPGTTEEIIKPILENSGLSAGRDFHLAHCPERIDPGNKKWGISNLPRVVGATTKEGLARAVEFYKGFVDAEVTALSSVKAAEAVKITENTFRDINIAFVNEMAMSFDSMGIDVVEVIKGAATKPFSFLPHYPGCGVGGHCIPVDPYYLIEKANQNGFDHTFLKLARSINKGMPEYTVKLVTEELNQIGKSIKGSRIGVLGLAYKADVDDIRESPSFEIIALLKKRGAGLSVYDPYVREKSTVSSLNELLKKAEYLLITTDHSEFREMDLEKLKQNNIKIVIDGRNCLDKDKVTGLGIRYKGIGK